MKKQNDEVHLSKKIIKNYTLKLTKMIQGHEEDKGEDQEVRRFVTLGHFLPQ